MSGILSTTRTNKIVEETKVVLMFHLELIFCQSMLLAVGIVSLFVYFQCSLLGACSLF